MNKIESMTAAELSRHLEANYPAGQWSLSRRKPVCGVGANDAPYSTQPVIDGRQVMDPAYRAWGHMLKRAYSAAKHARNPTYRGVTVCEEWHSFMAFRGWWLESYREGWHLDKDLLIAGNREYSPLACVYVPQWVNKLTTDCAAARGELPIGVSPDKGRYRAQCCNPATGKREHLGNFPDPLPAHLVYQAAKLMHVHALQDALGAIHPGLAAGVLAVLGNRWERVPAASCGVFDSGCEW